MSLRIVGDTNFWLSVAGWSGSSRRLYQALLAEKFIHLTSTEILAELGRILRVVPGFTDDEIYTWYCEIGNFSILVPPHLPLNERITICRDPDDNKFLECALWGQADILISRDKDLLVLDGYRGLRIQRPEALWSLLEQV